MQFTINLMSCIKEKGYKKYTKNLELLIKKGIDEIESYCANIIELTTLSQKEEIMKDQKMKDFVDGICEIFIIITRCVLISKYILAPSKLDDIISHYNTLYSNLSSEESYYIAFKDDKSFDIMYQMVEKSLNGIIIIYK